MHKKMTHVLNYVQQREALIKTLKDFVMHCP